MLDTAIRLLSAPAFTAFGAPTSYAEVLGFVTGAVCVYFVAVRNPLNWPIGIANAVFFIFLFATAGLYADSGLQVVYIVLGLYGWYMWLRGGENKTPLPVRRAARREWVALGAAGIALTALLTWILDTYTGSTVPFPDAVTTALSLMATWFQAKKVIGSWYLWIAADLIYIPLYQHKGLTLTAILYVGFLALCVYGLVDWSRALRRQERSVLSAETSPAAGLASAL